MRALKVTTIIGLFISTTFAVAQEVDTTAVEKEDLPFQMLDVEPQFPGGTEAMMEFISNNTKYPAIARDQGIQGRVFVTFVVEKDGSISNVEIIRGVHASLDKEAIRVMKSMPKWKPGEQAGKAVRSQMRLPFNFKLAQVSMRFFIILTLLVSLPAFGQEDEKVYDFCEHPPEFLGGQDSLEKYIQANLEYPQTIACYAGIVYVGFIVEKDGSISTIKLLRGIDDDLDAAALKVVAGMPDWFPGSRNGIAKRVKYTLPVRFSIY